MSEIKVSYEQIEKANKDIQTMKIGTGDYAKVSERIKAFRKVYPTGTILTEIEESENDKVRIKAAIQDEEGNTIATARATEEKKAKGKMTINLTDMIENCETSAVGRALGFAGFGIDRDIASGEDIARNKQNNKMYEVYKDMFIPDEDAKKVIKVIIGELMRKMGVVKASLSEVVKKELWTSLEEMTTYQLLQLEHRLRTLNMENNPWHELYNENVRIKEVVPKNQEVVCIKPLERFGQIALEQAGTDELLRDDIINYFLEGGIDLRSNQDG